MVTPQKLLLSIAATAAGFASVLGSVIFDTAGSTTNTSTELARATVLAPISPMASHPSRVR